MSELEWRTGPYYNPRLHYLYRGRRCLGLVSMLGSPDNIRGYSVYLCGQGATSTISANDFQCVMPTLEEAKMVLQTLAGAQLS
jgi:hypothetical protein